MAHTVIRDCATITLTDTKKQEGAVMNLYQNENHSGSCKLKTPSKVKTKVEQLSRMFNNILRDPGAVTP